MKRYLHNIHQVHIADGFSNDCDELIHRCLQLQTLNYEAFCNIWKDMNFGMIYVGRNSGAEIAELSEEVIYIAKSYMVKDTDNFEESVAGVFLVYGLLTLQPFRGFALLRIVPDNVPCINRIEFIARRERRLDVLYILGEILIKHSQYHAVERDRGMESVLRKYLEGYTSIDKLGVRPRGVFFRQNEELDIIRDLGSITRQYARAKTSLIGHSQGDSSLQYINENLPAELSISLRKIINGIIDTEPNDDEDNDDGVEEESTIQHYDAVQAIKMKAMANTVNPIQHLNGIEERKQLNKSPKKKSDLKAPTGKIKSGSPTKPITNSRKRKTEPKTRKRKRKETKNLEKTKEEIIDASVDLNVEDFQKGKAFDGSLENNIRIDERELKMESLPSKIQTEDHGQLIEIEIIDNVPEKDVNKNNNSNINETKTFDGSLENNIRIDERELRMESLPSKIQTENHGRLIEIEIIDNVPEKDVNEKNNTSIDEISEDDTNTLTPSKRKRNTIIKKRGYKRTKLKSKFKKMGMLPVANFKEQN
ncbi:snRNA-activating protein complex subunit 1-like [Melitaea cinxia]|uniref:snRNA-activating protein complex subunit 1-like n=1 Tax=Melitaea cinxia TaxID=113334 RepID=UPI001E273F32|nr:snRNA-activating protein complex subunit 1-like [Melitaea cinxia]